MVRHRRDIRIPQLTAPVPEDTTRKSGIQVFVKDLLRLSPRLPPNIVSRHGFDILFYNFALCCGNLQAVGALCLIAQGTPNVAGTEAHQTQACTKYLQDLRLRQGSWPTSQLYCCRQFSRDAGAVRCDGVQARPVQVQKRN
jgi:hypothetical protein